MSWKEDLYDLEMSVPVDLDTLADVSTEVKNDDIGFVNPVSGAGILARENGVLEGFSDYGLGFRFSRDSQSLMVFAPSVHIFSQDIQTHDKVIRSTYLRDEYEEVEKLLSDANGHLSEEAKKNETL